jgi:hypothetical protein
LIETDEQRRWWFATHPEYSWSHRGIRSLKNRDNGTGRFTREELDRYVAEWIKRFPLSPMTALLVALKWVLQTNDVPTPLGEILASAAGLTTKQPEATIGPPPPPGLSDHARSVLEFVFPGMTKAYDRWRIGYYEAYPWAPGPLYDALGDLAGLAVIGLGKIQAVLAKAVNPAEIAALQNAHQELLRIWEYANFPRGWAIEDYLGRNLPRTFKGIDRWMNQTATSIKSIHLNLDYYQDPAKILTAGRKYVDKLIDFDGAVMGNIRIRNQDIGARVLRLGMPPGATDAQKSALKSVIEYGERNGVKVEVIRVP